MKYSGLYKKNDRLAGLIAVLPEKPGIYQFFDSSGKIIYIGKARNLRKRVQSYFVKNHDNRKTAILVRNIEDIRHMVVETEQDALLLENNLIKKYQPRYNIRLKDDKTYPWICIKNEPFSRVFKTRNLIRDGSKYFGPYTSIYTVRTLLDLFKSEYKLRTCNYKLTPENIAKGNFKVCLEYHIGNCFGPCEGKISEEEYNSGINEIHNILKGNISGVIRHLQDLMKRKAEEMDFEEAHRIKEKYESLMRYQSKSTIVSPSITDVDVYTLDQDDKMAYINFLKVIQGAILQTYTLEIKKSLNESTEELLMAGIIDIRQKIPSNAREILVPVKLDPVFEGVRFRIPQIGDKKKLLELSYRNAKYFRFEKVKHQLLTDSQQTHQRIMRTIQEDLQLPQLPVQIECFDNSNLQGSDPVAACVVFKQAKPVRKEYRHFNIKSVQGPDDFASMKEVVYRRYRRLLNENKPLPQLVVIDGGKGQLSAARQALKSLDLHRKISLIGIAKRLEEIYYPGDSVPLYLNKNSETLKVIQQLRDEAHRFGITFHRNKRSAGMIHSELESIPGVGEKTISKLLKELKSVRNIKEATEDKLIAVVGPAKAGVIYSHFHKETPGRPG